MRAAALWAGWLPAPGNQLFRLFAALLAGIFVKGHLTSSSITSDHWAAVESHSPRWLAERPRGWRA
jgi:hypothetical protein